MKKVQHKNRKNNNKVISRIYGENFKVNIFIDNENIKLNSFDFIVCEKTTLFNVLKLCFQLIFPNEDDYVERKLEILWKYENNFGFDKFWTTEFKQTMTLEYLKYFYDDMYTNGNLVFLKIK